MKKRNYKYIIVAVLAILGLSVVAAYATTTGDQRDVAGMIREKVVQRLTEELDLSVQQVGQIKRMSEANWQENKGIIEKVIAKAKQLREELEKEYSDEAKIAALVQEINVLRGTLLSKRIEGVMEIKQVLTPDQFASLKEKLNERRQFRQNILKKWFENRLGQSI